MREIRNLGDLNDRSRDQDKLALIDLGDESGPRKYTFSQLDRMANGAARGLLARGLKRGDRIAILSANRTEFLAAYYGAMRAGIVAVPVNFKFLRETIHYIIRDCGASLVFCDAEREDNCPGELPTVVFGSGGAKGFDAFLDTGSFESIVPAPDEAAMYLYTSGSTGKPKGVVLSHQSHIWVVQARMAGQDLSHHRFLIAAPLYHMNALALSKLACAAHASIVMLPQFTARAYVEAIGEYRCTSLTAVPPMIAMMLSDANAMAHADFASVEFLRMGSAPVSPSLLRSIGKAMPNATVNNAYGTTEGGPVVFGPHPQGIKQPELSVGHPHPLVHVRLVNGENLDADQGVLQLKCPAVMTGYLGRPDIRPPFSGDGFYITGDVFRRDEHGFHFFVGRVDDMFVSGGENIYPGEVEKMLESHPSIVQACVVPIDDDIKGQKPVAFCVLRAGSPLIEAEVKQYALAKAPPYQHPRFVWFLDKLPLASTNKVDRDALKARAHQYVNVQQGASMSSMSND
ncbi:class I adenylate-forming enzyme family protein [Methylibium sp.]|uniref:class I adenylate-forming enzyme family protein n=1 Tax=Methylibium sp. TaxID=2067992 RepID=UPI0017AFF38B|nr:class I adenylate-forming enzyme family protein [Methylibium sp.]MBA3590073.1 acyl--CoA ligase [Methylibium sp.]